MSLLFDDQSEIVLENFKLKNIFTLLCFVNSLACPQSSDWVSFCSNWKKIVLALANEIRNRLNFTIFAHPAQADTMIELGYS